MRYHNFSPEFIRQYQADQAAGITNPYRTEDASVIRRNKYRDTSERLHRPPFCRDIDKIMHVPPYNRYAGKTQVFSFVSNDDISRRGLHVQLVARTARTISRVLGLNEDLTEAIALGHDLGHTPFGHAGERILSDLYHQRTGRFFNHNVHSVRVPDHLYARNVSLQVLDGILCHNGESSQKTFTLGQTRDFARFDSIVESCYRNQDTIGTLRPSTLEGCVVRISDMIAYVGKDRQDAIKTGALPDNSSFSGGVLGVQNAHIINNLTVDICQHSYMQNHISMSEQAFQSLKTAKAENYERIYLADSQTQIYDQEISPMFQELYQVLLDDLAQGREESPLFKHHICRIEAQRAMYADQPGEASRPASTQAAPVSPTSSGTPPVSPTSGGTPHAAPALYRDEPADDIVVDYLAAMTDSYFLAAHRYFCPQSKHQVTFGGYFDGFPSRHQ